MNINLDANTGHQNRQFSLFHKGGGGLLARGVARDGIPLPIISHSSPMNE